MKLQKKISQNRRDFVGIFVCEHCNNSTKESGYDDTYFHNQVIPNMKCSKCNKTGIECDNLIITKPKYNDAVIL